MIHIAYITVILILGCCCFVQWLNGDDFWYERAMFLEKHAKEILDKDKDLEVQNKALKQICEDRKEIIEQLLNKRYES